MPDRFYVQNTGDYRGVEHPYAWGVCDRNSNAMLGWGNPSKEWAERIARALNIVEAQKTPTNSAMSPCELFCSKEVCRLGRTFKNNDRIHCGSVACQLTQPQ